MTVKQLGETIKKEMAKVIVGQEQVIEQVITAFLAGGHVILEGVPGLAKTILARTFAKTMGTGFSRIQFTPDLMPSDILGTMIYDLKQSEFVFKKGPVFSNILLADEINRTSPKTQAALLEVMQERQVSIEGKSYPFKPPFMVLATQNPIEFEGTYPLPEAQLDRFLMKIKVDYPDEKVELDVLRKFRDGFRSEDLDSIKFQVIKQKDWEEAIRESEAIKMEDSLLEYILQIVRASREDPKVLLGISSRAGIHLSRISRIRAALDGRDYAIPDDIKQSAPPVLRHRLILQADAEIEGYSADSVIGNIIESVRAPR